MSRNSLISSRRTRALRERPANDTRLLPTPSPTRRWKVHRLYAANPSLGSLPRLRPLKGALTPGHGSGGRPDTIGSPVATAPRLDSPVASLGTSLSHGDGMEDTPDPLRTVESVWGSYPSPDSPVLPLGDSLSPRDGRESALPSLRMVERLPHTDRPELPSSLVDLRVWRGLAFQPLRLGHGPSIAYTTLPSPSFQLLNPVIPAPRRWAARAEALEACPEPRRRVRAEGWPTYRQPDSPFLPLYSLYPVIPDPDRESIPGDGVEGRSPTSSPLTEEIWSLSPVSRRNEGDPILPWERHVKKCTAFFDMPLLFLGGGAASSARNPQCRRKNGFSLKQSKPCLKSQNNQNPAPPLRHSRLRSGIYPEERGRVPVGATGWSPWGGAARAEALEV